MSTVRYAKKAQRKFERELFDAHREEAASLLNEGKLPERYFTDDRGWILFGPRDIRDGNPHYLFCLQQIKGQKKIYIRVGCRYYDLKAAWKHWSFKATTGKINHRARWGLTSAKNEGRQAVAIIRLMLLQAQAYGLINRWSKPIKFDSSLTRKRKK